MSIEIIAAALFNVSPYEILSKSRAGNTPPARHLVIAYRYYKQGQTQQQIANDLGIARPTVNYALAAFNRNNFANKKQEQLWKAI